MRKLFMVFASVFCGAQLFGAHLSQDWERQRAQQRSSQPIPMADRLHMERSAQYGHPVTPRYLLPSERQEEQPLTGSMPSGLYSVEQARVLREQEERAQERALREQRVQAEKARTDARLRRMEAILAAPVPVAGAAALPAAGEAAAPVPRETVAPAERPGCCAMVCYTLSNCFNIPGGE